MTTNVQESQRRLHKEASSARMKRDDDNVKKVFEVISNWRSPFEPSEELLSLSSGYVASESMKADLLLAKEKGTTALTAFVEERLVTNSTGFFQTLPKLKVGSFRDAQKKTSVTVGDRNFIIRAARNLFVRLELPDGPQRFPESRAWSPSMVVGFIRWFISQDKQSNSFQASRKWSRMPAYFT